MAFSMAGRADLAALKSRMALSWALLNRGTHCCIKISHLRQITIYII